MYSLLVALAVSLLVVPVVVLFGLPWYAGVVPAVLLFGIVAFLVLQWGRKRLEVDMMSVQARMAGLQGATSQHEVKAGLDEARSLLRGIQQRHGRWQLLLSGQIDGELGMLDYMEGRFDEALPLLERPWRNWMADVAAACVHHRRDRPAEMDKAFTRARSAQAKEPTIYVIQGLLLLQQGRRAEALQALADGLAEVPTHPVLKQLKQAIANKDKVDPTSLGEVWYRFFPEDQVKAAMVRGRRGPPPEGVQLQQRQGPPVSKARGKLARRR